MKITDIRAREVLDSRGNPTVEVDLTTDKSVTRAMVPSGASAGSHEALELRDKDERYMGKGVLKAVKNVNDIIAKNIVGMDCSDQEAIDKAMIDLDGTENKDKLGANAILPVSMACAKAAALEEDIPEHEYIGRLFGSDPHIMPVPQCNVINGGRHAGQDHDIQEHMMMPIGATSFSEGIRMVSETYHHLAKILKKRFGARGILIGDEGGFVPPINTVEERLDIMTEAIKEAGYEGKIVFALDAAASEFYDDDKKVYMVGEETYSPDDLVGFYAGLVDKYPIISLEDGMSEDDWDGWVELTKRIGDKVQIVGDDLIVTNTRRIKKALDMKAMNSSLIKLNQIGTVTETLESIRMTMDHGCTAVVSHRSGETEDPFIASLVVGVNAGQSKFGAPARSDRNAKYNELLRIEELLGGKAKYAGRDFRGV